MPTTAEAASATVAAVKALPAEQGAEPCETRRGLHRAVGLGLMSVLPALFWTAFAAGVASLSGSPLTVTTLAQIAIGIAAFLLVVCAAVTARAR